MKKILFCVHFCDGEKENSNNRFNYIYNMLIKAGYDITFITSSFSHRDKKQREPSKIYTYLYEPNYKRNISLKRFYAHYVFSKNLKRYLNDLSTFPDIVYCAIPSHDVAYEVAKFCERKKIKFILDIQDLWPEAFQIVFNIPIINKFLFYPIRRKSEYAYKRADKIIAVSNSYLKRGMKAKKKLEIGTSIYLGTDLKVFDEEVCKAKNMYRKKPGEICIGYLGTLGSSYDILTSLKAIKIVQEKYKNVSYILLGDGPLMNQFQQYAKENRVNAVFLGRLAYYDAMKTLKNCDIALNPFVKGAAQSIINKVGDYAALGLPVINSLENDEYRNLLSTYNAGVNVDSENEVSMANAIMKLLHDSKRLEIYSQNSYRLAKEKFDRNKTYKLISNYIEGLEEN